MVAGQERTDSMARDKVTLLTLQAKRDRKEPITMITGYDYPTARAEEAAGVDIILVGDSMAMTVLGYDSTLPISLDTMIVHAQAVRKGAPNAYLIGDMPYMSYQISTSEAIRNAGRYMSEAGCDCVKIEGGSNVLDTVEALVKATIPVMGHIGLTPQSIAQLGGFKAQGRTVDSALKLIKDAKALENAGACMILVEAVPPEITKIITEKAGIPIIGIGAGPYCDGQLLIVHDMLGWFDSFTPKFVKKYADLYGVITAALTQYVEDVRSRTFPAEEHNYSIKSSELSKVLERLDK